MPKVKQLKTSFAAGELAPELHLRSDTTQYRDGAKSLRNCRLLVSGGFTRRPGSWKRAILAGASRLVEFVVNERTKYLVTLGDGRLDAYLPDGTAAGGLAGCPWTGAIWSEASWVQSANTLFVTHPDMPTQVVTRTGAASWSRAAFAFYTGAGGRIHQPYYKVVDPAVTLTPSALTGSITLTSSAAVFVAGHVGSRIRYHKREIQITAVGSNTSATGTVIEELPATQDVTVSSAQGFAAGQVVEGSVSGAKGVVAGVAGSAVTVVLYADLLSGFTTSDQLVGPVSASQVSAVAAASSPGMVTDWDEQLFSPVHGYPACVALHRNRLVFGGHPAVPNAVICSRAGNLYDFDVADGNDADAIFELIGDSAAAQIVQIVSAEQLIILTDKGPYYVPESAAAPFRPTSMAFYPFGGEWPASGARARAFDGGVVMVSGSLVVKLRPTGDLTRQWTADEVSLLSSHLIKAPVDAATTTNYGGGPERYAVFVNSDGSLAVMMLIEAQEVRNFVPWETEGAFRSVAALGGTLYAIVEREIDGATTWLLEQFDQNLTLDCATEYSDLEMAATEYPADEVNVVTGTFHLGRLADVSDPPDGPYIVGYDYELRAETLPPNVEDGQGNHAGSLMRIIRADVHVLSSARFVARGYELTAYQVTDDPTLPPPLRDGPQTFQFLGWSKNPTLPLTQADPLPLTVAGITMEVAY